jgi:anti-anti-sigma factor
MADGLIDGFVIEVNHNERAAVVVVRGEVDLATAPAFRAALDDALDGAGRVEVDLRDTTFMDSCGLVVLVTAHRRLGQAREALVIRDPSPEVRRVMDIAGVSGLFDVRTDGEHP